MKDSKSLLEGFEFNQNEEVLVESFSYLSKKTKTTWVAFLTNERFILKQSKVSLTGYGVQDGIGESEFAFIPLKEMRGIKIKKGRIVIDGNIYSNSKSESDFGEFGKGLFGGLAYNSTKEVYELLLANLTKSQKEFDFYLWTPEDLQFSTADQNQKRVLDDIVYAELRAVLKVCGVLVILMLGIGLCSRLFNNQNSDDNSSGDNASISRDAPKPFNAETHAATCYFNGATAPCTVSQSPFTMSIRWEDGVHETYSHQGSGTYVDEREGVWRPIPSNGDGQFWSHKNGNTLGFVISR